MHPPRTILTGIGIMAGLIAAGADGPAVPRPPTPTAQETALLKALAADPITAPYAFATTVRNGKVSLSGRVGTKAVYDRAVRIAVVLGIPFEERLIIDTAEVYRSVAVPGAPLAGPPTAIALSGAAPYVYPEPLFGYWDEPFYGFEPPAISYPAWWPALTNLRRAELGAAQVGPGPEGTPDQANPGQAAPDAPANNEPPPPPVPVALPPPPPPLPDPALLGPVGAAPPRSLPDRLTAALKSRAVLRDLPIEVHTSNGQVELSGKVPTALEAMLAYRVVEQTPGVRSIEDRLSFAVPEPGKPNPLIQHGRPEDVEPYLEAQLRRFLGDQAHLDRARVNGAHLALRGTVRRAEDRARIEALLRTMPLLRGYTVEATFGTE